MSSTLEIKPLKYRPLTEPDSFRLLLIQPNTSTSAPIDCSLIHTTLSLCDREIIDHYTALSYVWGDATQTARICVDGHPSSITATLESALRSLRDDTRVLRLWADALCIDQSNMAERAQQVRQMGRIYSAAQHTVIYLGPPTVLLEALLLYPSSSSSSSISSLQLPLPSSSSKTPSEEELVHLAEQHLATRPWFRRVWVFQELILSRDPWLQSGRTRMRWSYLCNNVLQLLSSTSKNSKRPGLKVLTDMHYARDKRTQTDLYNLLVARRGFGATDPRDMIFAHFGIASDRAMWEGRIAVGYEQNCESLYEDVAEYLFEVAGPRTVLGLVGSGSRTAGLASWAPNWSRAVVALDDIHKGSHIDHMMNLATLQGKKHYKFFREPRLLAYVAYQADVVSNVSLGINKRTQHDSARRTNYQKAVEDLRALYGSVGGSYTSGDKYGQYIHINFRGKEVEHEKLCLKLRDEWLHLIRDELPILSPPATAKELESHERFQETFADWLAGRAKQGIIAVGTDVQGMERVLYTHLHPNTLPSILNGRRFAYMKSGRVGVVPSQTREGDIIVCLAGVPTPFVLRLVGFEDSENLNERIFKEIQERILTRALGKDIVLPKPGNQYYLSYIDLFETSKDGVGHAEVIGESVIDGLIGWLLKECHEKKEFRIFALH